jgi:hypothetical protein
VVELNGYVTENIESELVNLIYLRASFELTDAIATINVWNRIGISTHLATPLLA